ncbi:hypothetical protein V8E36_004095 [Tilletia maclaganii]
MYIPPANETRFSRHRLVHGTRAGSVILTFCFFTIPHVTVLNKATLRALPPSFLFSYTPLFWIYLNRTKFATGFFFDLPFPFFGDGPRCICSRINFPPLFIVRPSSIVTNSYTL